MLTYNIEGYKRNKFYLTSLIKQFNPLYLFIQEHWLPYSEVDSQLHHDFSDYRFLSTSSDMFTPVEDLMLTPGTAWQGTTIGWLSEIDKYVTKLPIVSERFCGISFSNQDTHILAYTAYLPTSGNDDFYLEVLDQFYSDILNHIQSNSAILIGTDTNQSEKSSKRRSEAMDRFKQKFSLESILVSGEPTFHHNNQVATSAIDTILYHIPGKSTIEIEPFKHLCKLNNADNLSSHDVILGTVRIPLRNEIIAEEDFSNTYEPFVVKKPKWNESGISSYQEQSYNVLSQLFKIYKGPEFIPALTEMCSKMLVLSAEKNFETYEPNQNTKKKQFPFFSKEHFLAYRDHETICRKWRAAGRPQSADHPAKLAKLQSQRRLQKISRQAESEKALAQHEELMKAHAYDRNNVFRKLKQIRGEKFKTNQLEYIETLCGTYSGNNVLEGFCANTERLCKQNSCTEEENNEFYKMCSEDNQIILELIDDDELKIPKMQLTHLKEIIFKKLKLKKACDVFKLTVEHLRYCGDNTLQLILQLINTIIEHLNYMSAPQLNTAVATVIHKGKGKSAYTYKSYRQVRVTPLIGRLLDEFLRPVKLSISKTTQNINQYGFTEGITYMMGALQRHEVEKYCQDNKMTFFGCSLDGESAFEVVDRAIQLRELYCAGEKGELWKSSKYSYEKSLTQIKMKHKISRKFEETAGVKQGHINSSDNYKIYINPALNTLDTSTLGVWVGPINVSVTGVADDNYLMSSSQSGLQGLIRIAEHYGKRYRIRYGAEKTKITIIGSDIDMQYFEDTTPWTMGGESIKVAENNEHLGQVVSGYRQEAKNIDLRIQKGRSNLFSLLGPAFAYKCKLGPLVKLHIFRTFTCPIIRSGINSFALRKQQIEPISLFHRKILKSILHLSKSAPTPAIHFLLGELPIEGRIHRDMFSLFYSIWCNPDTKIHQIVKYLLTSSPDNSRTWAINLRHISRMYQLEDPLSCLQRQPPSKESYKELMQQK